MTDLRNIKLIVLDVDGTLTDGKIYVDDKDNNFKAFDVKDGFGIVQFIKYGGILAIITGKKSNIVARRAEELGIKYVYQGVKNKVEILEKILDTEKLKFENVCYIGDDINDLGALNIVGFSACPKDSVPEILSAVDYVSICNGGAGAVRNIITYIMARQGTWNNVINEYLTF